jgi:predicted TIM-barrel fold metal-dependent hydrolase
LADLDMLLNVQVRDEQLLDLLPLIESSEVRLVFDHCGRPKPGEGQNQPGFKALLELGRAGRAAVKLSGFGQFSQEPYPHADAAPYIDALLAAFTPERCVWGSDWPFLRAPERVDYGPLLMLVDPYLAEEDDKQKVFWETPRRVFGFED